MSEHETQPDEETAGRSGDDDDADDGAGATPATSLEQARIVALQAELAQALDKQRQLASAYDTARREFEAVRGRLEREHSRSLEGHKANAVTGLLSVLDGLDQALQAGGDGGMAFVQGVAMIRHQFAAALGDLGLQRFEVVGQRFDPELHEALGVVAVPESQQDGLVLQELRAGARVGERVVRPAQVVVGRHSPAAAPAAEG